MRRGLILKDIVGKTIKAAAYMKHPDYDDEGYLWLKFTDGSECFVEACYTAYTGASLDEYPTYIALGSEFSESGVTEVLERIELV